MAISIWSSMLCCGSKAILAPLLVTIHGVQKQEDDVEAGEQRSRQVNVLLGGGHSMIAWERPASQKKGCITLHNHIVCIYIYIIFNNIYPQTTVHSLPHQNGSTSNQLFLAFGNFQSPSPPHRHTKQPRAICRDCSDHRLGLLQPEYRSWVAWKIPRAVPQFVRQVGEQKSNFTMGYRWYMEVSWNRGTPKSSILMGFSLRNHPFWGSPIYGTPHIYSWWD